MTEQPKQSIILLVDHEPSRRGGFIRMVKQAGYGVITISSSEKALQAALIQPPSLTLINIDMPEESAFALCSLLKRNVRTRNSPVIFIAENIQSDAWVRAFDYGNDIVLLSWSTDEILTRIGVQLTRSNTPTARRRSGDVHSEDNRQTLFYSPETVKCVRHVKRTSHDGLWDWNLKNDKVFYSPSWKAMLGYREDELAHHLDTWKRLVHPEDRERTLAHANRMVAGETDNFHTEFKMRHKDDHWILILSRAMLLRDEDGKPVRIIGTHVDISTLKYAEKNTNFEQTSYQQLVGNISDKFVFYSHRIDGLMLSVSDGIERVTGIPKKSILGAKWQTSINWIPGAVELAEDTVRQMVEGDISFTQLELSFLHRDGGLRTIIASAHPVHDESGDVVSIDGFIEDITERKRAELEQRVTQDKLQKLFEFSPLGIMLNTMDGRFVEANPALLRMTGYSQKELKELDYWSLTPARYQAEEKRQLQSLYISGRYGPFEKEFIKRDGNNIPVSLNGVLISGSDGQNYIWSTVEDITERRAAEEKIRLDGEQQTILRSLLEYSLIGAPLEETLQRCLDKILSVSWQETEPQGVIFLTDQDRRRLKLAVSRHLPDGVRSACKDIDFYTCLCGSLAGKCQRQLIDCDDVDKNVLCRLPDRSYYHLPLTANGVVEGLLMLQLPLHCSRDKEKQEFLNAAAGILAGYISRKAGEQALNEHQANLEAAVEKRTSDLKLSEERTLAIVSTMIDSVVQIDAESRILFVNQATLDMFGYSEEEVLGQNVNILMPDREANTHGGHVSKYLRTRRERIIGNRREISGRRKNGERFPIEVALSVLEDDKGISFIGVMRELTAQKAAEKEIRQALNAAEAAAEAKSSFLANMSHEIRTPLNAVLGLAQIGLRDCRERKSIGLFQNINKFGKHLISVVDDILDFSKIEAGKLKVERSTFSLISVINNVKNLLAIRAEEKNLKLSLSLAPDLSNWVDGDARRLTQVLTNLLSNAIKFTEHGSVVLHVKREGDEVLFTVMDSGIGISEAQMQRLFLPFEQADGSNTRNYGGAGLGLSISRELARMMGGEITLDSRQGHGSNFYLRLPLPAIDAPEITVIEDSTPGNFGRRLKNLLILAAEDVDINRFLLEDILEHEGARVMFAADGREALELINSEGANKFDIVLMDVQMPNMNGYEATRHIARLAPDLPVIGLTAHALEEERNRCLASGMVDHVTKPIDPDTLVSAIQRIQRQTTLPTEKPNEPKTMMPLTESQFESCNDPDIIDLCILVDRIGHDPDKIRRFISSFINTFQNSLNEMQEALATGDMPALGKLGHSLKPAAKTVGAMRFGQLCEELESVKELKEPETAQRIVEELLALFKQINQRLKEVIAQ